MAHAKPFVLDIRTIGNLNSEALPGRSISFFMNLDGSGEWRFHPQAFAAEKYSVVVECTLLPVVRLRHWSLFGLRHVGKQEPLDQSDKSKGVLNRSYKKHEGPLNQRNKSKQRFPTLKRKGIVWIDEGL